MYSMCEWPEKEGQLMWGESRIMRGLHDLCTISIHFVEHKTNTFKTFLSLDSPPGFSFFVYTPLTIVALRAALYI